MPQDLAFLMPAARPDALMNPAKVQNGAAAESGQGGFGNVLSDQMRQADPPAEPRADDRAQARQNTAGKQSGTAAKAGKEGQPLPATGEELPRDGQPQSAGQIAQDSAAPATATETSEADREASSDPSASVEVADIVAQLMMVTPSVESPEPAVLAPALESTAPPVPASTDPAQILPAVEVTALTTAGQGADAAPISASEPPAAVAATGETAQAVETFLPAMTPVSGQMKMDVAAQGEVTSAPQAAVADLRTRMATNPATLDPPQAADETSAGEGRQPAETFASVLAEKNARESSLPQAAAGGEQAQASKPDMSRPLSDLEDLVRAMDMNQKGQAPQATSGAANASAPNAAATAAQTVQLPFQHPKWGEAMAERVVWMVNNQMQEAGLRLNPAHLGPIEVKISMENDQANIQFTVQHGQVKEAVEAALPRLRDMLAQGGVQLQDANVADQQARRDQQQASREYQALGRGQYSHEEPEAAAAMKPMRLASPSLVDYYI